MEMFTFSLTIIFIFGANFGVLSAEDMASTLIVSTKQGKVEGFLSNNSDFYEFSGIKYALPVKFREPLDPPSFKETFKANVRTVFCPQFPTNDPLADPSDTEDCLVLNIFTPSTIMKKSSKLPVMVFLHGGDFGVGSSSPTLYSPPYLVTHDVIVVTVNYRLNAYGFLNLGIKEAPGNAGLKDIRAALRWIRDNISSFGGDENNVTVFGQGSGGIAAIYLMLSESTKGLFHKIISQSGSPFSPQSFDGDTLATASQVAKALSVNTKDPNELLKVYSETDIKKVEEAISKQMNPKSVFRPSVEKVFEGEEPFLLDTPYNILLKGNTSFNAVPLIVGLCTVEGLISILDFNTITSQLDRIKNQDYSALDQSNLVVSKKDKDEVRDLLRETYFGNDTKISDGEIVGGLVNLNTDFQYVGPMSLFADLYYNISGAPIYSYVFHYLGNRNFGRVLTNTSLIATTNLDELYYIFELEKYQLYMSESDARIVTFLTTMWTDFAKHGTPTPPREGSGQWLPHPYHLALSLDPEYVTEITIIRAYLWRYFYLKYGAELL